MNDDDYSDVFSLDSNAQRQDLETELFGTEEEVIGNEDDTDIVNINDEESEPLGDDETSSADGCTAGPTVHFHQEKWIEKIIMERKTMFGEMAGAGVCDLEDDVFDGPG